MTVDEQFAAIKRGALEIVPEEALKAKFIELGEGLYGHVKGPYMDGAYDKMLVKLGMLPDFGNWGLLVSLLIIPLTVQWWSVWYPGAEPCANVRSSPTFNAVSALSLTKKTRSRRPLSSAKPGSRPGSWS